MYRKEKSSPPALCGFRWALSAWVVFATVVIFVPSAIGSQPNYKLCFPNSAWFHPSPPDITTNIHTDHGWDGAFTYDPGDGVVIRGITDGTNLYLSIDAGNLDYLDEASGATSSLVVLAFDPDGTATHMQRIFVYPVNSPATLDTVTPVSSSQYWRAGLSGAGAIPPPPAWLGSAATSTMRVTYHQDPTLLYRWSLAMKIPIANVPNSGSISDSDKVQVPTTGNFGLYIDVFRVRGAGGQYYQTSWPGNAPEPGCIGRSVGGCTPDDPMQTPSSTNWGTATLDKVCGGASITLASADNILAGTLDPITSIFTPHTPNSKIATNKANTFRAYIQNTSIDASSGAVPPTPVAATVKATFRISNWGMPSPYVPWDLVPTDSGAANPNPTGSTSIDASACTGSVTNNNPLCLVQIGPWNLTSTQVTQYTTHNGAHQCIQVFLEPAPGSNTIILNNLAQRNMDFGSASKFERTAEINTKGYPPRLKPDGTAETDQLLDLHIITRQEVLQSGPQQSAHKQTSAQASTSTNDKGAGEAVSRFTWIAEGCRHTGRYMTINNQVHELCETVGRFGYVVQHVGAVPIQKWKLQFSGQGIEKVPGTDNLYRLHVANNDAATVKTEIEPEEPRLAIFFDGGAGIPQGTFSSAFNTGFSLNAGLEYMFNAHFSAEGIFGYHHFPAKIGSSLNVYQFSGNAKIYLMTPKKLRPFVNFGPGGYKFSPGSANFGGNVGGGLLFELNSRVGIQGSYNFHVVNTAGGATKFSAVQGGLRFVL